VTSCPKGFQILWMLIALILTLYNEMRPVGSYYRFALRQWSIITLLSLQGDNCG
jgi:hypothetical protein